MVPNITRGSNFGRLTEYLTEEELNQQVFGPMAEYLTRPKQGQTVSERVGFIELVNFQPGEARTPAEGAKVMALTARNAAQLKRAAGVKATGRKATSAPVWHLSLSWKPGEQVDKAEMMKSVDNALRTVKLDFKKGYQTIIVQHIDTEHPHVHVQINLVHPVTGKQHNPYKDRERLQVWSHKYDRSRGNTFCEYRAWKYEGHQKELKPERTMNAKSPGERRVLKVAKKFQWAMNEAAAIRETYSARATAISQQNAAEYQARRQAKDILWQELQKQQTAIKDSYRDKIRDHHSHSKARNVQERGRPVHLGKEKEWRGLNRRLRVAKEEFLRKHMAPAPKGHRPWVFNNVADDIEFQTLKRDQRVARAVTEQAILRRNSADLLRKSKDAELSAASTAYEVRLQQLKVLEAEAKLVSRARWRDLSRERAQAWKDFAKKHGLDEKKREISADKPQPTYAKPKERDHLGHTFDRHADDHARDPDSARVPKFNWLARQSDNEPMKPQMPVRILGKRRVLKLDKDFQWAANEASALREIFAAKENEISRRNTAAYEARRDAKDALWQEFQEQRAEIKERYQVQIRDHFLHKKYKEGRGQQPKGPTHIHDEKLLRGLNHRLRTAKDTFFERVVAPLSKGHRSWLFNNVANDNKQAQKQDQKATEVPTEQAIIRQNRAAQLRLLRDTELAKASAAYEVKKQQLKVQGAAEKMASRATWLRLSQERAQAWKDFSQKHGMDENKRMDRPGRAYVQKKDRDRLGRTFERHAANHSRDPDSERMEEFNRQARRAERFDVLDAKRDERLSTSRSDLNVESIGDRFNRLDAEKAERLEKGSVERARGEPGKRGRGWER